MKITTIETTIECTPAELRESNTLSDNLCILLKRAFQPRSLYDYCDESDGGENENN